MAKESKKGNGILIDKKIFRKLSPLQQRIISELSLSPLMLEELSEKAGSTVFSTGKQLSILQFRTKYNPLVKKGINEPLVKKTKDGKTVYSIIAKNNCLFNNFEKNKIAKNNFEEK